MTKISVSYPVFHLELCPGIADDWLLQRCVNIFETEKPASKLVFVYNYSWQSIYSRKGKERKVQYFLQSHAWELCGTICHFFHLPYKYFFLLHQCQLAAFILQRQIEMWFAFLELEELLIMTNIMLVWTRSEQVGTCVLSRCLVSASDKQLCFCQFIVVEKIMWGVQYLLQQ